MEYEAVISGWWASTDCVLPEREQPMIQPALPQTTGPHAALDQYGRLDHYYWKCESCGLESTDPDLERGCPRCAH